MNKKKRDISVIWIPVWSSAAFQLNSPRMQFVYRDRASRYLIMSLLVNNALTERHVFLYMLVNVWFN